MNLKRQPLLRWKESMYFKVHLLANSHIHINQLYNNNSITYYQVLEQQWRQYMNPHKKAVETRFIYCQMKGKKSWSNWHTLWVSLELDGYSPICWPKMCRRVLWNTQETARHTSYPLRSVLWGDTIRTCIRIRVDTLLAGIMDLSSSPCVLRVSKNDWNGVFNSFAWDVEFLFIFCIIF